MLSHNIRGTQSTACKEHYVNCHRFNGDHMSLHDIGFCRNFQCIETAMDDRLLLPVHYADFFLLDMHWSIVWFKVAHNMPTAAIALQMFVSERLG